MNVASSTAPKRPRRWLRAAIIAILALVLLVVAGVVLMVRGQRPLEDGTQLADGRIEVVSDGFIGAYIVELDEGGVILVDATMDPSAAAIRSGLSRRNLSPSDVKAILFTHGHGDHIAGARSFPATEIYALEADVDLVEGRRTAQSPIGKTREAKLTGIEITRGLNDGDRLVIGGTKVEVFAVPGHTLGSAAYLIHGVLFLGDSAAATRDGTITGAPPVFSADRGLARRSLRELAAKLHRRRDEVEALAFGHQGPVEGIEPLLEWAGIE